MMKKANYFYSVLGFIFLAILIFISRKCDVNMLIPNIFIVPIAFLIVKGFYKGNSTFSFDMILLISITLGVVLVSLLTKNVSAIIIIYKVISNIFSAGVVLFILYLKRKRSN